MDGAKKTKKKVGQMTQGSFVTLLVLATVGSLVGYSFFSKQSRRLAMAMKEEKAKGGSEVDTSVETTTTEQNFRRGRKYNKLQTLTSYQGPNGVMSEVVRRSN